jgi:hypothetical protein
VLGWAVLRDVPRASVPRRFATTLVLLFVASLFFTIGGVDDGARPRYLSTALLPLAWLAASGWRGAADFLGARLGARACRAVAVVVIVVLPLLQLIAFVAQRTPDILVREGLERAVAAAGLADAIVIVRAAYPTRYARNGAFFDRPVLYVSAPATIGVDEVAAAFPGRPVFEAREGQGWALARVR